MALSALLFAALSVALSVALSAALAVAFTCVEVASAEMLAVSPPAQPPRLSARRNTRSSPV
jgi:hypothetical protein